LKKKEDIMKNKKFGSPRYGEDYIPLPSDVENKANINEN
jgi:hypothetical protein